MRISSRTLYQNVNYRLSVISDQMKTINEQISTGKKINRPSDDPVGITHALRLKKALSQIEQFGKNAKQGETWLQTTESSLQTVNTLTIRAKEIANTMATGTYGADQRENAAEEVQSLIDQMVQAGNTRLNGRYIFSGYLENTPAVDGTTFQYQGDLNDIRVQIGPSTRLRINLRGNEVFGENGDPANVFEILNDLKDSLEMNQHEGAQSALERLNQYQNRVLGGLADVGSRLNRLESNGSLLTNMEALNTENLAEVEDADAVKAVTDLNAAQQIYQAALYSATQVMKTSLLDYM